jgi:hypothetical protein
MKILSVFGSAPQVIKRLQLFLTENRFSQIKIDPASNEITAERKILFLWKDYIHIRVESAQENVSNIELRLNPFHGNPSSGDETKEADLQRKLFLYF